MIKPGDTIPDVELRTMGADGPEVVQSAEVLGQGKVVLFAVPGAFTPGCSKVHLPGYLEGADDLKAKGVDRIVCVAVNDAWVMDAWAKSQNAGDKILMLADGGGEFNKALGLLGDPSPVVGQRSKRYSMLIEDGVVKSLEVESKPGIDVSSCGTMLSIV